MHVHRRIGVYEKERRGDWALERRGRSRRRGNALKGWLHCARRLHSDKFLAISRVYDRVRSIYRLVVRLAPVVRHLFLISDRYQKRFPVKIMIWRRKGSMRRDHVKQQWRTLRLPRNIHSVTWPVCLLVILGLYPVITDTILQDMGKSTIITFFLNFSFLSNSISSIIICASALHCPIVYHRVIYELNCFIHVICVLQFHVTTRPFTSMPF